MSASRAFFLDTGSRGQRLCLHFPAATGQAPRARLLFLPPFAEEMNKSRRMVALQARAFAQAGCEVLLFDPLGCGDSSGDFGDAGWQDWLDDAQRALQWLQDQAGPDATPTDTPMWLWALRGGALLAGGLMERLALTGTALPHLLLWQPLTTGKLQLQQFLRLRVAADLIGGQAKGVVQSLRDQLARGEAVEVAGYQLSAALAQGLEQAQLQPRPGVGRLAWLEVSPRAPAPLTPAATLALDGWRAQGVAVQANAVTGPSFWAATEIEEAPALLQASLDAVLAPLPRTQAEAA